MTTPAAQTPDPVNWTELIAAGRATLIAKPPDIQPAPAAIRRAISTAYYAAFHALTANNAEVLIGTPTDQLTTDAWIRIYRGLNHNHARPQLQQNRTRLSVDTWAIAALLCYAEARGHGIAPVRRGHPAYPYMRDADGDGIVCG